ncbi:MAG: YciI family protein [Candidatus Krumholzibacteriia bacterium]
MKRFAYFYFMADKPREIQEAVPKHVAYWKSLGLHEYQAGPFGDRSGGLIAFGAGNLAEAEELVCKDPFLTDGLLAQHWLKEWTVE